MLDSARGASQFLVAKGFKGTPLLSMVRAHEAEDMKPTTEESRSSEDKGHSPQVSAPLSKNESSSVGVLRKSLSQKKGKMRDKDVTPFSAEQEQSSDDEGSETFSNLEDSDSEPKTIT